MDTELPPNSVDKSVPIEELLPYVQRWVIPLLIIFPALYVVLHGLERFIYGIFDGRVIIWHLVAIIGLTIGHEVTHAVGWIVAGRLNPRVIRFGIDRKTLSPYAHSTVPMKARAYRIGGLLPTLTTAILPGIYALITGYAPAALWAAIMLVGALGDFAVIWLIRDVPPHAHVIDHPKKAGCIVINS